MRETDHLDQSLDIAENIISQLKIPNKMRL